jgi:hypothetical protein
MHTSTAGSVIVTQSSSMALRKRFARPRSTPLPFREG